MPTEKPLVKMESISKHFGGIQALTDVSVELFAGEVVGILGHNGAGKSTLIKILAGAEQADQGRVFIRGEEAEIQNPNDARRYGIETIYQELALCGNLDAPSNLFMGRETEKLGLLNKAFMRSETDTILRKLGIKIKSLDVEVESLSGGQRQSIAIGRAVYFEAKILIMDEPTAALGMEETKLVIDLIQELKKGGIGIFWISHDIHDIYAFTDRIAILKGGRNVVTCATQACSQDEIVSMIISGNPAPSLLVDQDAAAA
ncbi:MAG: ATP-binding cassette domain-containing protein [Albidovulum sp.]|nr:ATP-binding cassette domain-containing protein [Albidovulum sp.]MDE0306374.1 ATP-binding cassette domain-containing protein [Albidovulum sp.]MDE0532184.1 ATP-binding cassette domain-containing protein [Albidovulum sp.]